LLKFLEESKRKRKKKEKERCISLVCGLHRFPLTFLMYMCCVRSIRSARLLRSFLALGRAVSAGAADVWDSVFAM